jgi:biotin synthase
LSVLEAIKTSVKDEKTKRVCIQALNYPNAVSHLVALTKAIKQHAKVPVSISCQPLNKENIRRLAEAGVNRVSIALDAATKKLFTEIKGAAARGPYSWETQLKLLREAVEVFGKGNVSTHLIIGLGETERDVVHVIQHCADTGVLPALFAFTPIRGTALEGRSQPGLEAYRRIQLARHLIVNGVICYEQMRFDPKDRITDFGVEREHLNRIVETGAPFLTSGCPDCNRPFYNEKPSGPLYNFPRSLSLDEIAAAKQQLGLR